MSNHDHWKTPDGKICCFTDPNCEVNYCPALDEATHNGWRWMKGDDFPPSTRDDQEKERSAVWGIHKIAGGRIVHSNAIEVYTSCSDRDAIVTLLNDNAVDYLDEPESENLPIGKCKMCGTPVYTDLGFCGTCRGQDGG